MPPGMEDTASDAAGDAAADAAEDEFSGSFGGDVTFGQIEEDWFVYLLLQTSFSIGKLSFGIQAPLRFRVIDEAPEDDSVLREEDWDEVSDYFKILRFAQWSKPGDVFYARLGELNGATIGHGTIMRQYLNVVDIDHFQLGFDSEVNTAWGGGEVVLDNLADPDIFGIRLFARPWAFVDVESFATGWSIGTSFIADFEAPDAIEVDEATMEPIVDDDNNMQFTTEVTPLWGIDSDFTVVDNDWVQLTPYTDFNLLFGDETGLGYHLGFDLLFFLPLESGIDLKLEYRFLGDHYAPQYIDSLYEVQRVVYPSPVAYGPDEIPLTKRTAIGQADNGAHGYLGELAVSILKYVRIVGSLTGSQRERDNNLTLQLLLPEIPKVKLGALYTKSGFDDFVDAFDPDGAYFQAFARVNVWAFIDIVAHYSRRWHLVTDESSEDFGTYEVVDDWGAGIGFSFGF